MLHVTNMTDTHLLCDKMACYSQVGVHVHGGPHVSSQADCRGLAHYSYGLLLGRLVLGLNHFHQGLPTGDDVGGVQEVDKGLEVTLNAIENIR